MSESVNKVGPSNQNAHSNSRVEVILGLNDIAIPLKRVCGSRCGCGKGEWCNDEPLSLLQVQECGVDLICWSVEGVSADHTNCWYRAGVKVHT